eukprot:12894228-Prorocentrum_lima.AAC.1
MDLDYTVSHGATTVQRRPGGAHGPPHWGGGEQEGEARSTLCARRADSLQSVASEIGCRCPDGI